MRDSVSLDLKLSCSENGRRMGSVEAATTSGTLLNAIALRSVFQEIHT